MAARAASPVWTGTAVRADERRQLKFKKLQRPTATTSDPWATVVDTGLTLLEQRAAASRASSSEPERDGLRFVQRGPESGQPYVRIPLPSAEVLDRALEAIGQLLGQFK